MYEALRAGPGWGRTLMAVVYDDTGGWYDQVVPPFVDVPNDGAPCNLNVSAKCQGESGNKQNDAFDFKRLGLRTPALLISPWVRKGDVFQEPKCSAEDQQDDGRCPQAREESPGGKRGAKTKVSTAQFEHSSIPATVRNLFNLTSFLTKRDAWAGDFSSLLLQDTARTDAPMHLPDALPPALPWCSQLASAVACKSNDGCTWNAALQVCKEGPVANASAPCMVDNDDGDGDGDDDGDGGVDDDGDGDGDDDGEVGSRRRRRLKTAVDDRRFADLLAEDDGARPRHCSARTPGVCQGSGEVTQRQRNRMATLGALTGHGVPDVGSMDSIDGNAANEWLHLRWGEYMAANDGR